MASSANLALSTSAAEAGMKQGTIVFTGTATVLLKFAGFTILTDPNSLHKGEKAREVKAAGLESKVRYLRRGDTYTFRPSGGSTGE